MTPARTRARTALALALLLPLGGLVGAQAAPDHPELPGLGEMEAKQKEMIQLFHEVERTLKAIDLELYDAGAGRVPEPEGRESGIERLLRSHSEKSDQAVSGIERILKLAEELDQNKSMGQCMKAALNPPPGQSGESPLDKPREHAPTQTEKTPDAPKPDPSKPESTTPQGEKPKDGRDQDPTPPENRPGAPLTDERGTPVTPGNDADRWGQLPERVRQVFQNQITDDMPLQYRDWIDAYYRRMNTVR